MRQRSHIAFVRPLLAGMPTFSLIAFIAVGGAAYPAAAQGVAETGNAQSRAWQPGAIEHARRMRQYPDHDSDLQQAPRIIPRSEFDNDKTGVLGTFQPGGATRTADNPFFQVLGTNGRSCFTCHQPEDGWSLSASGARARFAASDGTDPLFRLVDGATCPTDDVSTRAARRQAYKLLIEKGLIRIGLPLPAAADLQFKVDSVNDPYGCNTNPATGLTSPTTGIVSVYRRSLPATNLGFLSTIMWDGREPDLSSQALDATLGHAQADAPPTARQLKKIVAFESGIFTAQSADTKAGELRDGNAAGGPVPLSRQLAKFFIGVNDPFGQNPTGAPFDPRIFRLYRPWLSAAGSDTAARQRRSIARGEVVFNTKPIDITGVSGINDVLQRKHVAGFCGTCHDTPNVGDHSVKAPLNIGVADAGVRSPPGLDISGLPVFRLECTSGPLTGKIFVVTDPGRATISGQCADIGKIKGPILRGLAARAPYFHNGSAATLLDVVNFYDQRFAIGFTDREKQDLVNFLNAL